MLNHIQEIVVGFRTPAGYITTVESFKTLGIPRLIREKASAWDPNRCLVWADQLLTFLKSVIRSHDDQNQKMEDTQLISEKVWRVRFVPHTGVEMAMLDEKEVEEVRNGEDRVGFLPRFFWDAAVADTGPSTRANYEATRPTVPPGWNIV